MKFGVMVSRHLVDRNSSQPFNKLYRYIEEMEDLGYDLGWCGHHRFSDTTAFGGEFASEPSAPMVMLAGLAARTSRIKFCTNIMILPAYHPIEVAEQILTLNEMSNNRFILGAGIGYKPEEFEQVGWKFKTRARRMEECLQVLQKALTGNRFSYHSDHFDIENCALAPSPLNNFVPPIWIGAVSEPAMLRAGKFADGWIVSFAEHILELQAKIDKYKATADEHERPSTVCLMRDVHVVNKKEQIDPNFLPNVVRVWQSYANLGANPDRDEESKNVMLGGKAISLDDFAPHRAVVGTPDDCIAELQHIQTAINPEYLFLTPTGVPNPEQQIKELRLFAKEVMPHFK
ncbi:LLM class flavin-dependent oxidoreductase [Halioxenophilus sp. WMMB6]|uniref:LLM class flavin-dependent oxidoreductase n=1 Tax=Halioxenophilus sp. WMMB6 TaxID=3073815 RepID=UPI00295F50C3|nr:LLM class flavin-dependent oxidoreductase [Halioxenophilus sp. WMMB6]